jgi:sugar O-acyltransferase (sialic acid O-acetyltransferase NeuD family)
VSELKDIAIVGAGGFGKETLVMINQINAINLQWQVTGFYDDGVAAGGIVAGLPVLGNLDALKRIDQELAVVVAVGDPKVKRSLVERIQQSNLYFPTLIHPVATIGENIKAGAGCIITAGCRLTIDIALGDFVLLNLNTTVGHDVHIGSFTSVMPGVHLSGYVQVGEEVLIGTGASVLQNVTIGNRSVVGAGAVVNKNVEPSRTVAGVPARSIRKHD